MNKEELDKISEDIENNTNETEATKNLCVHDLRRKLKEKLKKETINKVIILSVLIFFIGFLSLLVY
ncbi:hypothetical protein ACIJYB_02360 [Candidatus Pelagibacter bacterium nBUS_44]|jgi:hypothetical protein|uniref:hypothetical protein n=1 Tax=Candidatus Pelagibacter bacterium nBUS_44 TaxID=3374195 RepID=UPI003EB97548|tara:strand:+ start:298 stop:495 length:198 start_codon:yes stop_codon:yes gene_type:complete